jgi:hypothetical protein
MSRPTPERLAEMRLFSGLPTVVDGVTYMRELFAEIDALKAERVAYDWSQYRLCVELSCHRSLVSEMLGEKCETEVSRRVDAALASDTVGPPRRA